MGETAEPLPWLARRELAALRVSAGVDEASIRVETHADGVCVNFHLATEQSVRAAKADIRGVEPIIFVYPRLSDIGVAPPHAVLSGRDDFPRDLGHLNPVKPDAKASLCLAAAGLGAIYDQLGLEGILVRLRAFLRDAKIGALMQDGWEAVPYGLDAALCPGVLDARFFQELAAKHPDGASPMASPA